MARGPKSQPQRQGVGVCLTNKQHQGRGRAETQQIAGSLDSVNCHSGASHPTPWLGVQWLKIALHLRDQPVYGPHPLAKERAVIKTAKSIVCRLTFKWWGHSLGGIHSLSTNSPRSAIVCRLKRRRHSFSVIRPTLNESPMYSTCDGPSWGAFSSFGLGIFFWIRKVVLSRQFGGFWTILGYHITKKCIFIDYLVSHSKLLINYVGFCQILGQIRW